MTQINELPGDERGMPSMCKPDKNIYLLLLCKPDDGGHSGWEGPDSGDDHWECREEGGCHQCEEGQVM